MAKRRVDLDLCTSSRKIFEPRVAEVGVLASRPTCDAVQRINWRSYDLIQKRNLIPREPHRQETLYGFLPCCLLSGA